jgi:hypothetical protein
MDKLVRQIELPLAKRVIERAGLYIVQKKDLERLAEVAADAYQDYPLHNWFTGGVYDPVASKLIMQISLKTMTEDAIIYAALSIEGVQNLADVQIAEYPKPQTTLEMLMESLGGTTPSVLAGTPFENIEAAFNTAQATETGKTYARLPYEYVIR